jgi:1,4-alpha-glucan branching enzyme
MKQNQGSKRKRKRTVFTITADNARNVYLVGDFNGWDIKKHPMKPDGNGTWSKTLLLEPGTYQYKFWVNDRWQLDPGNDLRCFNCFGTFNNIVNVAAD